MTRELTEGAINLAQFTRREVLLGAIGLATVATGAVAVLALQARLAHPPPSVNPNARRVGTLHQLAHGSLGRKRIVHCNPADLCTITGPNGSLLNPDYRLRISKGAGAVYDQPTGEYTWPIQLVGSGLQLSVPCDASNNSYSWADESIGTPSDSTPIQIMMNGKPQDSLPQDMYLDSKVNNRAALGCSTASVPSMGSGPTM